MITPYVTLRSLYDVEASHRLPELASSIHSYVASKEGRSRLRHLGLIGLTERYATETRSQEQINKLARAVGDRLLDVDVLVDNKDAFVGMITVQPDVHSWFVGVVPAKLQRRFAEHCHMPGSNLSAWVNTNEVDEFGALYDAYDQLPRHGQPAPTYWTLERASEYDRMTALVDNGFKAVDSGRIDDQEYTFYPPVRTLMAR